MLGTVIAGKYEVIRRLGEGGIGVVYEAIQRPIDRPVALKVLATASKVLNERFEREAKAASMLAHPNTVTVFDFGVTEEGRAYLAMEKLTGHTLGAEIYGSGALEQLRALRIFKQVCASVGHAHKHGVVHRDLKPDNIFLAEVAETRDFVKVLDFGLAKLTRAETLTSNGSVFGTPRYMSPEQATGGNADPRSDVYALGVILFEMLTGKAPFEAEQPVALLYMHVQSPPPRFKDVAPDLKLRPELEPIVTRALAKKPEHRFQTVQELVETIDKYVLRRGSGESDAATAALPRGTSVKPASPRPTSKTEAVPRSSSGTDRGNRARAEDPGPEPGIVITPDGRVEVVGSSPPVTKPAPRPILEETSPALREDRIKLDVSRRPTHRADRAPKGEVYVRPFDVKVLWKIALVAIVLVLFEALIGRGAVIDLITKIFG